MCQKYLSSCIRSSEWAWAEQSYEDSDCAPYPLNCILAHQCPKTPWQGQARAAVSWFTATFPFKGVVESVETPLGENGASPSCWCCSRAICHYLLVCLAKLHCYTHIVVLWSLATWSCRCSGTGDYFKFKSLDSNCTITTAAVFALQQSGVGHTTEWLESILTRSFGN